ncbi:MAG: hypothetical protein AAF903_12020 [Pseudomonadota bacterium]
MSFPSLEDLVANSVLVRLRNAIIADLKTAMPFIKTVEEYGGQFSGEGVKRVSASPQAIYVSIIASPKSRAEASGQREHTVTVSLFVLSGKAGKIGHDDAALAVAENCAVIAHHKRWGGWPDGNRLEFAQDVKIARIASGPLNKQGVTLIGVTWQQAISLGVDRVAEDRQIDGSTVGTVEGEVSAVRVNPEKMGPQADG